MKKITALVAYFHTRFSFYPLCTGVAIASLVAFLMRNTVVLADNSYGDFTSLSFPLWILIFLGATLLAAILPKPLWPLTCYGAWLLYAFPLMASYSGNVWMLVGVLFLIVLLTYFVYRDTSAIFTVGTDSLYPRLRDRFGRPLFVAIILILTLAAFWLLAFIGVYRYLAYYTPCFDFGIFTQMFESMRTTFLPTTTCERFKELSHFSVHLSPIYYVLLPIYCIFPHPITLAVSQALIVASSVIPLALIARRMNFSRLQTILAAVCIAFYPALHGGTFYDLHENCFLTPLILWFFYFLERRSYLGMFFASIAVFLVKEDAAIYIAFIALYLIFSKREMLYGGFLFALSVAYFLFAITYLAKYGEGAMNWRYQNLMLSSDDSLTALIFNVIKNPGYALSQCFNAEKGEFLLAVLAPMAGTALLIKRPSRIILLGPLVLITLLSDYYYQHSIFFQYNFGIIAILFYLALLNLQDIAPNAKQFLLIVMAVASLLSYTALCTPTLNVKDAYDGNRDKIALYNEAIEQVDRDRSISATTFLVPHLYDCKELYEVQSSSDTEQILLMLGYEEMQKYYEHFLENGYTVAWEAEGVIALLEKNAQD